MTDNSAAEGGIVEPAAKNDNDTTLERLVERAIGNQLSDGADGVKPDSSVHNFMRFSEKFSGPFAHPDVLRQLNEVVENGAERAFNRAEKEQEHRHKMDEELLKSTISQRDKEAFDRRLIIILLFCFLTACLAGAFAAVITGHNVGGGIFAGVAALISAGGILLARSQSKKPVKLKDMDLYELGSSPGPDSPITHERGSLSPRVLVLCSVWAAWRMRCFASSYCPAMHFA